MEHWKYKEITENYYRRNIQQLHNKKKKKHRQKSYHITKSLELFV
jgi:hypothetical protein